ncbi:MAG: PLP-dependent aminotransferase family protein [Chthoniobacteraceae bacterium]|nr:PLP-dependent aminotransferase family protein [Chthoniobacteraceae bacterium]
MIEPFLFQAPARLVDFMRQADQPEWINLAAGVPGLDALPFAALREAAGEVFASDGASLFSYHHPEGDPALRTLLAERLGTRGVAALTSKNIVTTSGCTQALQVLLSVLVKPGDTVACEAPGYYGLLELIAEAGARILPLPVSPDGSGIDLDAAESALARWKPKCLVVCTSLSNPTGATLPGIHRGRLVALCRAEGVRLIEDDIYAELLDNGAPKPCRSWDDGSTVSFVSSFSKTVSPGLRVGYCVPGTPELEDAFAARKCQQDLHSTVISEAILRAFLRKGCLDPHLDWLRERNQRRRELALDAIGRSFPPGTEVSAPWGGYMLWVRLPEGIDSDAFRTQAHGASVAFADGSAFFARQPGGTPPAPHIRLNCARAAEPDLERGVEILGKIVSGLA